MKKNIILLIITLLTIPHFADACTGMALTSEDGALIAARTVEWGANDMQIQIGVFPSEKEYTGTTPEGQNGKKWRSEFGFVGMTSYGQPFVADGMNEKGLAVGMFYLPGFADYNTYRPEEAGDAFSVGDLTLWMLSMFATTEDVRKNLPEVKVVNVEDDRFGGAPLPFHWRVCDAGGKCMVIEITDGGSVQVFNAPFGVITNAPTYDWHLTNIRNYLKLSPRPATPLKVDNQAVSALGAGSGMLGLPGDFTPPSRFIRALAFTATARPLPTARDAVDEAFRILNNFDIPVGSILPKEALDPTVSGSTQFTSAADTLNRIYYYHTQFNRRVRMIDLKKIEFAKIEMKQISADRNRRQDIEEITVSDN